MNDFKIKHVDVDNQSSHLEQEFPDGIVCAIVSNTPDGHLNQHLASNSEWFEIEQYKVPTKEGNEIFSLYLNARYDKQHKS
ncbi:hypothetical protein OLK001_15380 [Synechocystis sp. LKSZ1]